MTLSIIIPLYIKPLDVIKRSIESALNQECDKELIIVYQHFSDECKSYLDKLVRQHSNIRVFTYKYPLSHHIARIKHIQDCKGKWVAFLDSDDYVDPHYYDDCISELEKYGADATPGNLMLHANNEITTYDYNGKLRKEDFIFGDYWLRGIFKFESIKLAISLFKNYEYCLTHHDDYLEKIVLFHCCNKIMMVKSDTHYHFNLTAIERHTLLSFKNMYSVTLIYHLLKDFIATYYPSHLSNFKLFIQNVMKMDIDLKFKYFNEIFNTFEFTTIPKIIHNNNFNFKYLRLNWYDAFLRIKDTSNDYQTLWTQFYILYCYGGIFCLDDYYIINEDIFKTDLLLFEKDGKLNCDIVGASIKHPIIEQCFQYLVEEPNKTEKLDYYIGRLTETITFLNALLLSDAEFKANFQKVLI
jgi:glycosyltransferase involved in cell wall biosynthesis